MFFPFYNINIQGGVEALNRFFKIPKGNPQELFHFSFHNLRKVEKRFNKKSPLLFINAKDDVPWQGDKIVVGKDIERTDPEIFECLYLCNAYHGAHDEFYEFAKMFTKKIVT